MIQGCQAIQKECFRAAKGAPSSVTCASCHFWLQTCRRFLIPYTVFYSCVPWKPHTKRLSCIRMLSTKRNALFESGDKNALVCFELGLQPCLPSHDFSRKNAHHKNKYRSQDHTNKSCATQQPKVGTPKMAEDERSFGCGVGGRAQRDALPELCSQRVSCFKRSNQARSQGRPGRFRAPRSSTLPREQEQILGTTDEKFAEHNLEVPSCQLQRQATALAQAQLPPGTESRFKAGKKWISSSIQAKQDETCVQQERIKRSIHCMYNGSADSMDSQSPELVHHRFRFNRSRRP